MERENAVSVSVFEFDTENTLREIFDVVEEAVRETTAPLVVVTGAVPVVVVSAVMDRDLLDTLISLDSEVCVPSTSLILDAPFVLCA